MTPEQIVEEMWALPLGTTKESVKEWLVFQIRAACAEERSRCADLCDQHDDWRWLRDTYPDRFQGAPTEASEGAALCAAAIRALGDPK